MVENGRLWVFSFINFFIDLIVILYKYYIGKFLKDLIKLFYKY